MAIYVIAYDIVEDRRREKLARVLLRFGQRIQKSVFTAVLDDDQHRELRRELGSLLRIEDALEMFPVDTRDAARWVSWCAEPSFQAAVLAIG